MTKPRYDVRRTSAGWEVIDTDTDAAVVTFGLYLSKLAHMDASARNRNLPSPRAASTIACGVGKHHLCSGEGVSEDTGAAVQCGCRCH